LAGSRRIRAKKVQGPPYYVTLFATVHPPGSRINIQGAPEVKYEDKENGFTLNATVHIHVSQIQVRCELDKLIDNYLIHLIIRAGDAARAILDLTAFSLGLGIVITFDRYKDIDGEIKPIMFIDPSLSLLCTAFSSGNGFAEAIKLVIEEPPLMMALNDLIVANTMPHQVPANCGRVVEGIRHLIAGPGTDAKKAWPVMKSALNIEKSFMDIITDSAMPYRHGHRVPISGPNTQLILARSWQIMDRYLHLRLRNLSSLATDEFPLLVG